jgi:adenine-specific DNA-methyltransferase
LTQIILDMGLPLSLKISAIKILEKTVYKVSDNALFVCFDTGIESDFAREIAKQKPERIVFRDSTFKDDTAKENVKQLLKQLSPDTQMRII